MFSEKSGVPQQESLITEIKSIIAKISRIDPSELTDEVNVREEVGIDSLMAMEIIATCEKHFGVLIDENRYIEIETIGDFIGLIVSLVRGKDA